jgi:hypothetical protein
VNSLLQADHIDENDKIKIVGKDKLKGLTGFVKRIKKESGVKIYTVELECNGKKIDRYKENLKKIYTI